MLVRRGMGGGEWRGEWAIHEPFQTPCWHQKNNFSLYKGSRVLRVLGGYYSMWVVVVFGPEGPLGFGPIASQNQPVGVEGT